MNRRSFLKTLVAGGVLAALPVGRNGWAFAGPPSGRRLVVVFLRGAVDGLSVVVPYAEEAYYELRPRIALPRPGEQGGVLDLDGRFGLHPALAPLQPYFRARQLAFVHAAGSPDPTRSHFDAQDFMESGTPGRKATGDGWLNRLLAVLPGPRGQQPALGLGESIPRILAGQQPVANIALGAGAARPLPTDRANVAEAFDRMYAGDDVLARAYREGQASRRALLENLAADDAEMQAANAGAPLPNGFAGDATRLAHLLRRDPGIRLAFLALGGWDTHVNQGSSQGQLANRLGQLGTGLATLARELGPAFADTTILVMSEFGRTVAENGNAGTDHGHGNAMWLLGGPVGGGKVYGRWPGLAPEQRYQGRDLAITTDFRQVLAETLHGHLGLEAGAIARVLPDLPAGGNQLQGLIRRV
jgi:uncharacterized protein (DUF1501 family)